MWQVHIKGLVPDTEEVHSSTHYAAAVQLKLAVLASFFKTSFAMGSQLERSCIIAPWRNGPVG